MSDSRTAGSATIDAAPAMALHLRGVTLPEGTERDLFVVAGRLTFHQPNDATTILHGGYILPGLVDAHAHLALASPAQGDVASSVRVRASARVHLAAGVLAVREPGGPDHASIGLGPHEGLPRVVSGGRFLAPRGRYFPGTGYRATAEAELPAVAEQEARASGAWAKVIGEWAGADRRMQANYRSETLAAAVARVHAVGARMAVHAASSAGVELAIEAGVDSIEHGIGLRDDHIAVMASRGIALVPTLSILPYVPGVIEEWNVVPAERKALLAAVERHPEMVRRAAAAGVRVFAGTDAGMGPHGMVREEIGRLLRAGLSQQAALAAGSWEARCFLGLPGIEEGAPADLVAYQDDPRGGPAALAHSVLRLLDGHVLSQT